MPRRLVARAARVLFALTGAAFMAVAFSRTWDGSVAEFAIAWWRLPIAVVLAMAGLTCAFGGWATLIGGDDRRTLASGFYLSQLGKYIPGGVWQAIGQVGYTTRANVTVPRATTAFAVFALTQSAAGGLVGSTVAILVPDLPSGLRLAAAAGLGLCLFLHRRWMVVAVALVRRMRGHHDADELLPPQPAILRAVAWSVGSMVGNGAAFTVLLHGLGEVSGGLDGAAAVGAAALAWTAGFLALPVPAGIGVREAVLILLLGPVAGTSALIVASVYQRLVTIVGEALMIVAARWGLRDAAPGPGHATAHGGDAPSD